MVPSCPATAYPRVFEVFPPVLFTLGMARNYIKLAPQHVLFGVSERWSSLDLPLPTTHFKILVTFQDINDQLLNIIVYHVLYMNFDQNIVGIPNLVKKIQNFGYFLHSKILYRKCIGNVLKML